MAKKKKAPRRPTVGNRVALHESITRQITLLLARCEKLRDDGKLDEARQLMARIEGLVEELKQLES